MKEFSRAERVAEQVKNELASALLRHVDDPRLQQVTLMAVQMPDGLELARIFWLPLNLEEALTEREKKRIGRAFENATPFLRNHLANVLRLRIVPELRFEFDEASERGRKMDELLRKVREEDAKNFPDLVDATLDELQNPSGDDT